MRSAKRVDIPGSPVRAMAIAESAVEKSRPKLKAWKSPETA
jgi:hypothetical protein